MPRKRNRINTKGSWTMYLLENAVFVLKGGGISMYKLYSTLKKRYNLAKAK